MTRAIEVGATKGEAEDLGLVWIDCPYPLISVGLARILEREARIHIGREQPVEEEPSIVILGVGGMEGLLESIKRIRKQCPNALLLIFGLYLELAAAQTALRAGARGYIHTGMQLEQLVRAVRVATEGQIVAPRELLEYLISNEDVMDLSTVLSHRQQEILELVDEGLSNSQIAKRLFLTESTVKQHLRAAYKALGVRNRTEATRLLRNNSSS
jgi:DNA-binding NarL/FixJ family response regulator